MSTKWTSEQIPDQSGRTAIVTGANSGLGLEAARALGSAARDEEAAHRLWEVSEELTGVPFELLVTASG